MNSAHSRCETIIAAARDAGACAAAFTGISSVSDQARAIYARWLAEERNAGMEYMERYTEVRDNPALLLDGAQSMLCTAFAYRNSTTPRSPLFADYALGEDYHDVIRRRLNPVAELMQSIVPGSATRICIDTAPLRERYWAARAGLGFIGLNNHLIISGIGSRVFLADILWTADADTAAKPIQPPCLGCRRCIEACPGKALGQDGSIDCRRCLSYLTIEHRGDLPETLRLDGRIYGCDICQDVCPHNKACDDAPVIEEFLPSDALLNLDRKKIASMTPEEFRALFRHSAVRRAKLSGLLRNASHTH